MCFSSNFPKSWVPDELSDCMQFKSSFLSKFQRVNVKEFWKNSDNRSIVTCLSIGHENCFSCPWLGDSLLIGNFSVWLPEKKQQRCNLHNFQIINGNINVGVGSCKKWNDLKILNIFSIVVTTLNLSPSCCRIVRCTAVLHQNCVWAMETYENT